MLKTVQKTVRRGAGAWRRVRAVDAALVGLLLGVCALAVHAFGLELTVGLQMSHLPWLLLWLLACPVAGLGALVRRTTLPLAASEVDRRAGLADRLGTALEFAADASPMASLQRADAAAIAATVRPAALFVIPWRRRLLGLLIASCLTLMLVGAALTFQLGAGQVDATPDEPSAAEDLLASIDRERERMDELGNKHAVRLLTDMGRKILEIQAREEELRERVERRKKEAPPTVEEEFPEPDLEIPDVVQEERDDLITAEDLARLEADMIDQLAMTDAQEAELISELFQNTMEAGRLMEEFEELTHNEMEATHDSSKRSEFGANQNGQSNRLNPLKDDPVAEAMSDERFGMPQDPMKDQQQLLQRDLSAESLAEHDSAHDQQESFNQFLKEFVKDVKDIVADSAMGRDAKKKKKKEDEGRDVQVDTGEGMVDKSDAMAESGFEEMGDMKRSEGGAPPENMMGSKEGMKVPDNLAEGKPGDDAMAMTGPGDGKTSAGASGAGHGGEDDGSGLKTLLDSVVNPEAASGPLEEVLSQLSVGRMPPEEREALFERMARHKVNAGPASEADDVIVDYFAEAEELMVSNSDSLPALFRDYAHTYFEAIRPGAGAITD
jgi:hypothetical protein